MATIYWIRAPHHSDMFSEGYIGFSSRTTEARIKAHKANSKRRDKKHLPLYRAFEKYGDGLLVSTLVVGSEDYCLDIEHKLRPLPEIGWNIKAGGDRGYLGARRSEETRLKHSKSVKGISKPPGFGAKISDALKGIKKSEGHVDAMRLSKQGRCSAWENGNADKRIWADADKLFDYVASNPTHGAKRLANSFGVEVNAVIRVLKKLKLGWNPLQDPLWIEFTKDYNEKEAINAEPT